MSRVALLVATTDYMDSGLSRLRSPASDARDLGALLEDGSVGYFDRVVLLVNESKVEIEEHVERVLRDLLPDDTLLLYVSCHGIKDRHGRLFFTTARTKRDLPESTAISARFVEEQMSRCRARAKVLLLDCCFGGAYVQGMTPFGPEDGALSAQAAGKGTYVMTASDVLQFAFEGDTVKNDKGISRSVFTEAIIDGLSTGRADIDNDGVITAHELFQHIERHVQASGVPQKPTEFRSGVQGNIPIAKAALWHQGRSEGVDSFSSDSLRLGELLPALAEHSGRGLCAPDWPPNGKLAVPLGRMYDSARGLQETLTLDLSGGAPHVGIVGGRWSGKTSVLLTLACSLALTHTPEELQIYALHGEPDGMTRLSTLPHVGKVADYAEDDEVALIVDGVMATLRRREHLSGALKIRSPRIFRAKRTQGALPGESNGEVFLFIDSWQDFETRYPDAARQLLNVAQNGVYYGIHLAVSADRWNDIPTDLSLHFGTWIELSLADPRESRIDSDLAGDIPPGQPGFGLTRGRRYVRVAVPALARSRTAPDEGEALDAPPGDEGEELDSLVKAVADAWRGNTARPLEISTDSEDLDSRPVELLNLLPEGWAADPESAWSSEPGRKLIAPLGIDPAGSPVMLNLTEAAPGSPGLHGLCVGATGSGRAELLRSLVLGLTVAYSPETVNFMLVDARAGTAFAQLDRLPHVSAVIANILAEPALIDRLTQSLQGELNRRQELFRDSGNYAGVREYDRAREAGAPLQPIPLLVLVIDEFTELLDEKPDFVEVLVQICRLGRALGVHLLLASQSLEEGRLRGLDTYLMYRIALRTASAEDSRATLGVADAYHLPPTPGLGYLKSGRGQVVGFRAAASGVTEQEGSTAGHTSASDLILDRLAGRGPGAHQIWLPPLEPALPMDFLFEQLGVVEGRGLTHSGHDGAGRLAAPVGLVDNPYEQRRELLWLDFAGLAGNMLITGDQQSGKSTLLRTLISSLALTHTPHEVQFYCIDLGGGGMTHLSGLPHVGGVATRLEADLVRRTLFKVHDILTRREEYFRSAGISSVTDYRARRASGDISVTDQPWGDVFLVIDDWGNFRTEYEALEPTVREIAERGLGHGIHLVLTASRSVHVLSVKERLANRLELRLADPLESDLDRKTAMDIPARMPGRGQTPQRQHFMAALPRIDSRASDVGLADATVAFAAEVARHWHGPRAPEVRLLPAAFPASELPPGDRFPERGVAFALDENNIEPVFVDFEQDPFLLVYGESESGKSNLLRLLVKQLTERYSGDECKFMVVDNRRALLDVVPQSHLAEYVPMSNAMDHHVRALVDMLQRRVPTAEVTVQQLRDRSWWQGPTVYVVVDDYELVSTSSGNPLSDLTELLPFARDVGVRFIVARNSAGAGRASYEPFIQRLTELGAQGLILAGDPGEGDLLGVRPRSWPPGRGMFVSRRGKTLVQTALMPTE